jgi:hypothetical protein
MRLDALRRQAGVVLPSLPPRGPVPEDIRRLLGIRTRNEARRIPASLDRELPGIELAPGLRLVESLMARESVPETVDLGFCGFAAVEAARLMHFDTETTGLAGGTGTRAFMIGLADWRPEGLRLRQLTITSMAAETAMLEAFASWLAAESVLVSYNGRCYDSPLLATRYRLARMANPLAGLAHADLLFPVRRHFRGVWENCRLATVERNWLQVIREDDLPGSEAPRAWLDYLRGGSAVNLRRVREHNDQDLRSLALLALRLEHAQAQLPEA